jgi:chromosome segregation ATPase
MGKAQEALEKLKAELTAKAKDIDEKFKANQALQVTLQNASRSHDKGKGNSESNSSLAAAKAEESHLKSALEKIAEDTEDVDDNLLKTKEKMSKAKKVKENKLAELKSLESGRETLRRYSNEVKLERAKIEATEK